MLFSRPTSDFRKRRTGFFLLTVLMSVLILTTFPFSSQSHTRNLNSPEARATEPVGRRSSSSPRNVSATFPPTVTILSPISESSFQTPGDIIIDVEATDSDGVEKVDFYQGSTLLGTDDTLPYSFTWSNMPACTYLLTAKATDTLGETSTSAPVTVKVNGGIGEPTPQNFKIAFLGDQGLGPLSVATLNLVMSEGAQALVISGNLDYADDPAAWEAQLNNTVGSNFPVFVVAGNQDEDAWHGLTGYQKTIEARFNRLGIPWCGSCGVQQSFHYKGLFFVFTTPGLDPQVDLGNNDTYIQKQLAQDHSIWSISSWHKNMHLMQAGGRADETGWEVYEESRAGGAIIANAHEHSYFRTHLLSSMMNQTVASTGNTMTLTKGNSFVVVSGLGGQTRREQEVTGPWIGKIYATQCLPGDPICQPNAVEGALFGVFNVDGQQNKANFYFKDVNGQIIDSFTVISQVDMPSIDSITPSEVDSGGSSLTLLVNGNGFINESKLQINGITRPTSYLSSTLLIAQLSAADIQAGGVFPVKIVNAVTGGGVSNEVSLTVNGQPNPIPVLDNLSPASKVAGDANFTLTVNGSGFVDGSVVRWNGIDRPTTFVSGSSLTAEISATDIQTVGVASVSVFVPPPGGGITPALDFNINNPGYEADVAPRPNGTNNGFLTIADWVQIGRFASGLDIPTCSEFQRVDVAPRVTLGNGSITVSDWVQAGRYVSGLDPITPAGGPFCDPGVPPISLPGQGERSVVNAGLGAGRLVQINTKGIKLGKTGTVTITLESQGNENALGFSLNFIPNQLSYVSAKTGVDAREGTLIVNADRTAAGNLEVSLALPPGQHFDKGRQQLVVLTFKSLRRDYLPLIGFADQASKLEVVDFNAEELPADFIPLLSVGKGANSTNPINEARFFVNQNYLDFLGRSPESHGLDYWTSQITMCGPDQLCIQNQRVAISAAFFMEPEFQQTGFLFHRFYKAAFGSPPTYAQFLNDHQKLVNDRVKAVTTTEFARQFMLRPEFRSAYPDSLRADHFVTRLFDRAGIHEPASERRALDSLISGRKTRAQVLLELVESEDFKSREYNASFVLMQYFGYLKRDPDQGGYDFWLNVLNNQQPANYRSMVCSFITSSEYQLRFGSVAIRSNADCNR